MSNSSTASTSSTNVGLRDMINCYMRWIENYLAEGSASQHRSINAAIGVPLYSLGISGLSFFFEIASVNIGSNSDLPRCLFHILS
jgi:hypothetical protein